jgi:hypothetical protein
MGYYVSNPESHIVIKSENVPAALAAIKQMYDPEDEDEEKEGAKAPSFAWVSQDTVKAAEDLEDALDEWRWDSSFNSDGDLISVGFSGEKLGDDEDLWHNLAHLVEHGSYIEMLGEDDTRWRWVFWRGELHTEYPHITWPYEQVTPAMELAEVIGEELAETA